MPYVPLLRAVDAEEQILLPKRLPEMVRVPPQGMTGLCLSESLFRMPTHWDGKLTTLCQAPKDCELCQKAELREYFLLGFWDNFESSSVWVQLTPPAGRSLLAQCKQLNRPLHGTTVKITRARKKGNSPISVAVDQWANCASKLPTMASPQETIERVFGSRDPSRILHNECVE